MCNGHSCNICLAAGLTGAQFWLTSAKVGKAVVVEGVVESALQHLLPLTCLVLLAFTVLGPCVGVLWEA